jgi:hypothetical protein
MEEHKGEAGVAPSPLQQALATVCEQQNSQAVWSAAT